MAEQQQVQPSYILVLKCACSKYIIPTAISQGRHTEGARLIDTQHADSSGLGIPFWQAKYEHSMVLPDSSSTQPTAGYQFRSYAGRGAALQAPRTF